MIETSLTMLEKNLIDKTCFVSRPFPTLNSVKLPMSPGTCLDPPRVPSRSRGQHSSSKGHKQEITAAPSRSFRVHLQSTLAYADDTLKQAKVSVFLKHCRASEQVWLTCLRSWKVRRLTILAGKQIRVQQTSNKHWLALGTPVAIDVFRVAGRLCSNPGRKLCWRGIWDSLTKVQSSSTYTATPLISPEGTSFQVIFQKFEEKEEKAHKENTIFKRTDGHVFGLNIH